jgi:hypothetical protein
VTECFEAGLFIDMEKDLVLASLQAAAFGIANLYTADQLRYVAPALVGQEDLVAQLFRISIRAVLSEKGMQAIDTASGDPFR